MIPFNLSSFTNRTRNSTKKKIKELQSMASKFASVVFPLNPRHYQTKEAMDFLLDDGLFLDICLNSFGPVFFSMRENADGSTASPYHEERPQYWMDLANENPESEFAEAVFDLLSPTGHLCKIMQQASAPLMGSEGFLSTVKGGWGETTSPPPKEQAAPFARFYYIPLRTICSYSLEVIKLDGDKTDMTTAATNTVPSVMLIPFWLAPLRTRDFSGQLAATLACPMLPYFLVRMLQYLRIRGSLTIDSLIEGPCSEEASWWSQLEDLVRQVARIKPSLASQGKMPFYEKLLTAHLQYFLQPLSKITPLLSNSSSYAQIQWGTNEIIGGEFLHAIVSMWLLDYSPLPVSEYHRIAHIGHPNINCLLYTLPFLTSIWKGMKPPMKIPPGGSTYSMLMSDSRFPSHAAGGRGGRAGVSAGRATGQHQAQPGTAAYDVTHTTRCIYRGIISTIRQLFISLTMFGKCPDQHLINLFDLWACVLQPGGEDPLSPQEAQYFLMQHYEAFSVLVVDFFNYCQKSNFLKVVDAAVLQRVSRVFELLDAGGATGLNPYQGMHHAAGGMMMGAAICGRGWLQHIADCIQNPSTGNNLQELQPIRASLALHWYKDSTSQEDPHAAHLTSMFSSEAIAGAKVVSLTLYDRLHGVNVKSEDFVDQHTFSGKISNLATKLYYRTLYKGDVEKAEEAMVTAVKNKKYVNLKKLKDAERRALCKFLDQLKELYPTAINVHLQTHARDLDQSEKATEEAMRSRRKNDSATGGLFSAGGSYFPEESSRLISTEERQLYLEGRQRETFNVFESRNVCFTSPNAAEGIYRSDEVPFMLVVTRFLDRMLHGLTMRYLLYRYAQERVFLCSRCAQPLILEDTAGEVLCSGDHTHTPVNKRNTASHSSCWTCQRCSLHYCESCKGKAVTFGGLHVDAQKDRVGASVCRRCRVMLLETAMVYTVIVGGAKMTCCPKCATKEGILLLRCSTRPLASQLWLSLIGGVMFLWFVWRVFSTSGLDEEEWE